MLKIYKEHLGFTLIELLVVITILAILSAIAMSSYRTYTAKARVADAFQALEEYKLRTIKVIAKKGSTPLSTEILFPDGDNIGKVNNNVKDVDLPYVNRIRVDIIGNDVLIGARLKDHGPIVQATSFLYIAYSNNKWICGTPNSKTNTLPSSLLPSICNKTLP